MKKIFSTLAFILFSFVAQAQNTQNKTTVAPVVTPPPTVVAPTIITDPTDGTGTGTGTGTITPVTEVGNTEGQLSVSLTGAATYSIPIAVPPGINGVVPQISLNYSSQAGNGMAGYGWNIGGLSAITRVPRDKYHDGEIGTVNFLGDIFALDGQRLVLKIGSPAAYGKNGAEYETENFSNIKITSYSAVNTFACPESFKVEYPDGSFAIYGGAVGTNILTSYAINYWQNAQGVRISYSYNLANNFSTIASIKYGSTFGNTPINEIKFIYKARTRFEEYFGAALVIENKILNTKILSQIKVLGNGIGFRNYDLAHDTVIGYERLKSITEKTGDNTLSYRPTIFNYTENTNNNMITRTIQNSYLPITGVPKGIINGDFDGDGDSDYIYKDMLFTKIYDDGSNPTITPLPSIPNNHIKSYTVKCLDTNGKLMDRNAWCQVNHDNINNLTTFNVFSKNPTTNLIVQEYSRQLVSSYSYADLQGDFNGDGLTDFLNPVYNYTGNNATSLDLKLVNLDRRITTTNFVKSVGTVSGDYIKRIEVADVNADGKTDILVFVVGTVFTGIKVYSLDSNENLVFQSQTPLPLILQNGSLFYEEIPPSTTGHYDITPIYGNLVQVPPPIIGYTYTWIPDVLGRRYEFPVVMGDYNGDGKTDILLPGFERLVLMSTGNSFTTEDLPYDFPDRNNLGSLMPVDFNNDDKTDVLSVSSGENGDYSITNFSRMNANNWTNSISNYNEYNPSYANNTVTLLPLMAKTSKVFPGKPQIVMQKYHASSYFKITFFTNQNSLTNQKLLSNITLGNGVQENITYSPLTTANGVYTPTGQIENYPNYDIPAAPGWKVVSQISKQSSTTYKSQQFKYYGAVSNLEGLGFQGFRGRLATNWYNDPSEIISNITKHDIDKRGAVTESFSILGLSTPSALFSTPFISHAINTYNMVRSRGGLRYVNPLLSNKVYKLFNSSSENWDGLNGATSSQTSTTYDAFNNPTSSTTDFLNNGVLEKSVYSTVAYNNSLSTDLVYYRGRPRSKVVDEIIYPGDPVLEDATTSQELYAYNNHLLTQVKKKGNATVDELIEDNIYDAYGNITKKTITAAGLTPRVTNYEYDTATKRFLTKKIDIEGLETLYTNNSSSGMLLTETLPAVVAPYLPRTTTYLYDKWFKLLRVTDYLGKSVNYTYANNSEGVLKTTTADDGSMSTLQIDDLGRKIRTGARNIDTSWSYITKGYDNTDRPIFESAPYNGTAPPYNDLSDISSYSVWNESQYDVYGRVTQTEVQKTDSAAGKITTYSYNGMSATETDTSTSKVKTTVKNSLGNIVSVSDNLGGTIDYKYFANGNLKESICNGSTTQITQDGWGRKKSLYEPSVGRYIYDYNNFGETIRETVEGKGVTEYNINAVGKVIDKKIFGTANNLLTKNTYTFDPTTKLLTSTRFDDYANNNSYTIYNYGYDIYKRIISSDESFYQNNLFQVYFKRTTSFDDYGRPERQEYTAINKPDNKQSVKAIKNTYKLGYHHTILEDLTNKLLWRTETVDARGQLTGGTFGNGITITNTYDSYSYPSQKKHDLGTTNVLTLNTVFDPLRGNLTSRTNSMFGWNENFTYDNLDRLTNWGNFVMINNYTFTNGTEGFVATDPSVSVTHENTSITKRLRVSSNTGNAGTQKLFKTNAIINAKYKISGAIISKSPTAVINYSIVEKNPTNGQLIETAVIDQDPTATSFTFEYLVSQFSDIYLKIIVNDFATQTVTFSLDNIVIDELIGENQNYNQNGSISDNNIGSYAYTTAGMPFRASTITPPDQAPTSPVMSYYINRDQNITYNAFKSPITINEQGKENVDFEYNANNGRSVMYYGNMLGKTARSFRKYYSADGTMEIKRDILNNKVEFITYLGGDGYDAPIVNKLTYDATTPPSGAGGLFYLHRDYQGSIVGITNSTGQVIEKRLFDAWGALIKYGNLAGAATPPTGLGGACMFLDRGYTGHEHLLNVGLINMNGRIYDPKLHRFLQPDNNIQDPYNTQNYNRYGYVMNNPMKYTDPSGEFLNVIFGYIAAAYIYGAYGNGGELNPTKWDFSNPATYGAATQLISVYASVGMTNVANNYLQNYSVRPDLNATAGMVSNGNNATSEHNYASEALNNGDVDKHTSESNSSNWALGTLAFISTDVAIPEPTDLAWPKWAGYAVAGTIATAYLYSGDYITKMNREINRIYERTLGPPGFAYELVATKSGLYPNLNTGGTTHLKIGDVWKFGQTTQGFGRYPDNKIDLVRDNLTMIPIPPGGNQMQILIQEKYLIYGYFFLHGHRPPGNPIFR
jgi:RHS repeat-associated protein